MEGKLKLGRLLKILLLIPVPLAYYGVHRLLESSGGFLMIPFFGIIPLLALAGLFIKSRRRLFTVLGIIYLAVMAVMIVTEILFLPYRAYELWFELFRASIERGRVSHLFVKMASWLTALICWIIIGQTSFLRALAKILYLGLFFLFLLWPSVLTALVFLIALFLDRLGDRNHKGLIILTCLALLVGLTGLNSPPKGSRMVDAGSDNLITLMTDVWPALPLLYDIPLYGESLSGSGSMETGGRPTLTNNIIMTVTGGPGDQIYLRTRTYARNGESLNGVPVTETLIEAPREIPPQANTIGVTVKADFMNMIPFTGESVLMEWRGEQYAIDGKELTLLPEPALFMDESYVLVEEDDREVSPADPERLERFTRPGGTPSEALLDLAEKLRGDDHIETVRNIRSYLADNHVYSLDTEEDENYTEHFLFQTKEGYCLHFASSFVVLARLNGIPCRFVEGYLINFPHEEEFFESYGAVPSVITQPVTGLSSHVWPEIYLDGMGWVEFEVTAPFVRGDSLTADDRLTRRQLTQIQGLLPREEETVPFWQRIPPLVPILAGFLILAGIALWQLKRYLSHRLNRTSHIVARFIRTAGRAGISRPEERGWLRWEEELRLNVRATEPILKEILPVILKARYTDHELDHGEKEILKASFPPFKDYCKEYRRS